MCIAEEATYQPYQLYIPLLKLQFQLGKSAQLGSTDWCKVGGMTEQNCPLVSDPLVEIEFTLSSLGGEIGCSAA